MDLKEYFENTKGIGVIATADTDGWVDAAIYARPHIMEDGLLAFDYGKFVSEKKFLTERYQAKPEQITVFGKEQWFSPVASGSAAPKQMVVCPCSTGTLAAISQGMSDNLIERAADVVIKERGQLIMVPRETPFSTIHLANMHSLSQMGVTIMPAAPGFYHNPQSINDLIDFMVGRMLDHLGIEQTIMPRWGYSK